MTPIGYCCIVSLLFIMSIVLFGVGAWVGGLICLTVVAIMAIIAYLIWEREEVQKELKHLGRD